MTSKRPVIAGAVIIVAGLVGFSHLLTFIGAAAAAGQRPAQELIGTLLLSSIVAVASALVIRGTFLGTFRSRVPVSLYLWGILILYPLTNVVRTSGWYLPGPELADEELLGAALFEITRYLVLLVLIVWAALSKGLKAYFSQPSAPIAIAVCALALALAPRIAMAEELVVGVLGQAKVSAESPEGWRVRIARDALPDGVTVELTFGGGPDSLILMTVLRPGPGAPLNDEGVVQLVSGAAAQASSQSVEGDLKVERFERGATRGAYFSATDKAPPPGEFKYLSQGIAKFGDLAVSFTALSNVDGLAAQEAVLNVVGSLRSTPAE